MCITTILTTTSICFLLLLVFGAGLVAVEARAVRCMIEFDLH